MPIYFILWVIIQCNFIFWSNGSCCGYWELSQLTLASLQHTPMSVHLCVLSISLLSDITRYCRIIFHIFFLSPGINHFSQELWVFVSFFCFCFVLFLFLRMVLEATIQELRVLIDHWRFSFLRLSHLPKQEHICKCIVMHEYLQILLGVTSCIILSAT